MAKSRQTPRLRVKTGCQICRNRKKKCDETRPSCRRCLALGFRCEWPTQEDLVDRRHNPTRPRPKSPSLDTPSAKCPQFVVPTQLSHFSESIAHKIVSRDLKPVISRHFVDQYYGLLILPNCHPEYYWGWINEIQELMVEENSLLYSVLANAASHIHFIDRSPRMQELALTYYSHALRGLSNLLAKAERLENHNGFLMSVMLLYLHGCMGQGTYTDIPRHVNAAIRILTLRLLAQPKSISRPFDRLATESVLYQVFLVTTGSWSDPIALDYSFDMDFWLQAERLLDRSTLFPGRSMSFNSPVLGIPFSLFKLTLLVKQLYQGPRPPDPATLDRFRAELENWEGAVLCDQTLDHLSPSSPPTTFDQIYKDAAHLYILNASMLMDQLLAAEPPTGPPAAHPPDSWQVVKATQILRANRDNEDWARCFIGNWPVYTLGFFMSAAEGVALVRGDMQRRWDRMKFSQVVRFRRDLETTWAQRGVGP